MNLLRLFESLNMINFRESLGFKLLWSIISYMSALLDKLVSNKVF